MGCTALIISGGVLQIVGFTLIAGDLYLIQRDEFGTPAIIRRLRRLVLGPRAVMLHLSSAVAMGGGTLRVRGRIRKGPGTTLESRVEALEINFGHLESEFDQVYTAIKDEVDKARQDLQKVIDELNQEINEREEAQKRLGQRSRSLQAVATFVFLLGTTLGIFGAT